MIRKILYLTMLILNILSIPLYAISSEAVSSSQNENKLSASPSRNIRISFDNLNQIPSNFTLNNFNSGEIIEFSVRKDELVSQAVLHLQFTPSPALVPILSQLKIIINDELVDVMPISTEQLGKLNQIDIPIDPRYINDFNRLRLEFVGHYKSVCENPINSSIWIEIDKKSTLELSLQKLLLKNDLSNFPEPFFDAQDKNPLNLSIIFAAQPNIQQIRSAAMLASWFGSKALWRGVSFSALFNQLPTRNAVVFATNENRPDFLKNYKTVKTPTIEIISHPDNPYIKLLLILGRNDEDLLTAVQGISQGNILFRGSSIIVDSVKMLKPRKPYDAPNWIPTDKPVPFSQLEEFSGQLQTKGIIPYPISVRFNLPPDLYLNQGRGIDLRLKYRYSLPPKTSISELDISLNNYFINSYLLDMKQREHLFSANLAHTVKNLYIPANELGVHNQFAFQFQFGSKIAGGLQDNQCITYNIVDNFGVIDPTSTINFSNYYHYLEMPNLNVFVSSGFPFSRMADLSETVVFINSQPQEQQITTLLNAIGLIGGETGYPALAMTLTDNWSEAKSKDMDLLTIGKLPEDLNNNDDVNLLLNKSKDWVKEPFKTNSKLDNLDSNEVAESKATIISTEPVAAFVGIQSPYYKQRSIISLIADSSNDYELLNKALTDHKNYYKIAGSVAVIRNSGIKSLHVGNVYHLGNLPWWVTFWFALQQHPINLALISLLAALIVTFLIWNKMSHISQRRLKYEEKDKK